MPRHRCKPRATAKQKTQKLTRPANNRASEAEMAARRAQSARLLLHMRKREMVSLEYDIPVEYKDRGKRFLRISVLAPRPVDTKQADDVKEAHWNDVNQYKTWGHLVQMWLAKELEVMVTRHNYFDPSSPSNPEKGGYQYKQAWLATDREAVLAWATEPSYDSPKSAIFLLFAAIARFPDQPIDHRLPPGTEAAFKHEQAGVSAECAAEQKFRDELDSDLDSGPCSQTSDWNPSVQLGPKVKGGVNIAGEGGKWHIAEELMHRPAFNSDFGFNPIDQLVQSEKNPFFVAMERRHKKFFVLSKQVGTFEDVVRWWYRFRDCL